MSNKDIVLFSETVYRENIWQLRIQFLKFNESLLTIKFDFSFRYFIRFQLENSPFPIIYL